MFDLIAVHKDISIDNNTSTMIYLLSRKVSFNIIKTSKLEVWDSRDICLCFGFALALILVTVYDWFYMVQVSMIIY